MRDSPSSSCAVRLAPALIAIVCAPPVLAQVAASPNHQLESFAFASTGGGTCSPNGIAFTSLGEFTGGTAASIQFTATLGFVDLSEPDLPAGPVIFGIAPHFGPESGGTRVVVSGFHFDKLGAGPTNQVFVDGVPGSAVITASNTSLSFVTPQGSAGPKTLTVANTFGTAQAQNGFVYAPAIVTPATVAIGGTFELANYGAPGDSYLTFLSTTTTTLNAAPYGTLLIGPAPLIQLLPALPYGPTGEAKLSFPVPVIPHLAGFSVHFQAVTLFAGGGPPPGRLTNATTSTFQ